MRVDDYAENIIRELERLAAHIGANRNIPPGLVAKVLVIRNDVVKIKESLEVLQNEAD